MALGTRRLAGRGASPFTRITPKAASEMIAEGNVQLIDVRNQDEWDAGHVPGATLIPVDDLFTRMDELDGDKKTSLHLRHGSTQAPWLARWPPLSNIRICTT